MGHTKNMCDRFFNTLKRKCRRTNIFTIEELIKLFDGSSDKVSVHAVKSCDFKDWNLWLDTCCKRIKSGMVSKSHAFSVTKKGTMVIKADDISKESFIQSGMHQRNMGRRQALLDSIVDEMNSDNVGRLKGIKPPGMSERKQMELGMKHRKLVPH